MGGVSAKRVVFFKEGDPLFTPVHMVITNRRYRNFDSLLTDLNKKMDLINGVRRLCTPMGIDTVNGLDEIKAGGQYICSTSTTKKIKKIDYDQPEAKKKQPFSVKRPMAEKTPSSLSNQQPGSRLFNSATDQKVIRLIAKEDPTRNAKLLLNRRTAPTMEAVLQNASDLLQLNSGVVSYLCTTGGRKLTRLEELMNGPSTLLAVGRHSLQRSTSSTLSLPSLSNNTSRNASSNASFPRTKPKVHHTVDLAANDIMQKYTNLTGSVSISFREDCTHNFHLTMCGEFGERDPILIKKPPKGFRAASVHECEVNMKSMGKLYKIRISTEENNYTSVNWCSKISFVNEIGHEMVFRCQETESQFIDGVRELTHVEKGSPKRPVITYQIQIETGEDLNAGTDSSVYLMLVGSKGCGDTGKRYLRRATPNQDDDTEAMFQQSSIDVIELEAVYLGEIRQLIIGHDNDGAAPSWYVDKIIVKEKGSNDTVPFVCKRWLDGTQEDRKIERKMVPAKVSSTLPPLKMNKPKVQKKKKSANPSRPTGKRKSRDNLNAEENGCQEASNTEETEERCPTPEELRQFALQLVQQTLDRAVQILQEELEQEAKAKEVENQQKTPKRMPVPPNGAKPDNVRRSPIPKGSGVPMARKKMWESNNIQKDVQPVKEEQKEMEQTTENQSQIDQ